MLRVRAAATAADPGVGFRHSPNRDDAIEAFRFDRSDKALHVRITVGRSGHTTGRATLSRCVTGHTPSLRIHPPRITRDLD